MHRSNDSGIMCLLRCQQAVIIRPVKPSLPVFTKDLPFCYKLPHHAPRHAHRVRPSSQGGQSQSQTPASKQTASAASKGWSQSTPRVVFRPGATSTGLITWHHRENLTLPFITSNNCHNLIQSRELHSHHPSIAKPQAPIHHPSCIPHFSTPPSSLASPKIQLRSERARLQVVLGGVHELWESNSYLIYPCGSQRRGLVTDLLKVPTKCPPLNQVRGLQSLFLLRQPQPHIRHPLSHHRRW